MNHRWLLLVLLASLGCERPGETRNESIPEAPGLTPGTQFTPTACGELTGVVRWEGPLPNTPPTRAPRSPANYTDRSPIAEWPHPQAPRVDPRSGGLGGAVVFLRGIAPAQARPWDYPAARIEIAEAAIDIVQGDQRGRIGFVPVGSAVDMISRESLRHLLCARGAAFFSQPLTEPGITRTRTFNKPGPVELSSGAGYFWMRAHLFVCEHPYFTQTDARGRFTLKQVPAGPVEVVAWLPNWREVSHEVNSDTGFRTNVEYAEPLTIVRPVSVTAGQRVDLPAVVFRAQ